MRFGLVEVDFETLTRTIRSSGRHYGRRILARRRDR
jgi:beta-glucosidase/6-phospho-beta-glucosidase/beta-galactosidase